MTTIIIAFYAFEHEKAALVFHVQKGAINYYTMAFLLLE